MVTNARSLPLADWAPRRQVRVPATHVPRAAVGAVDVHNHLGRWLTADRSWMAPDTGALLSTMDRSNVDAVVNLDGRWGRELVQNLDRYDRAHPGRFATFCQLDWSALAGPRADETLVASLTRSAAEGARGLKVWKDLGLTHRDPTRALVLPDDPRLAPVWAAAGDLGLPVLIHTADPVAFFQPLDRFNERLDELGAYPEWWFGGPGMPSFERLLDALEAIVAAHPATTFIGAHVGGAAEDLSRVGRMLAAYPNYSVDIGGRMAELGRQPRAARRLVLAHPDRVLFGTDAFPPSDVDYARFFRFLETDDECFGYADEDIPPQGRWDVSALDLPAEVLPLVYADNARRLIRFG
jgi:predicted TIM-barrel fold metal-dependent hydrolase